MSAFKGSSSIVRCARREVRSEFGSTPCGYAPNTKCQVWGPRGFPILVLRQPQLPSDAFSQDTPNDSYDESEHRGWLNPGEIEGRESSHAAWFNLTRILALEGPMIRKMRSTSTTKMPQ